MGTSPTQFEMLVNFMEENGDINKPTREAAGRIQCIQKWETVCSLLNSDPAGDTKTVEKWKKVWSDLKNNTKKKAAKINKAIRGTGGGPALNAHLNEVEKRVLAIIGVQAVTGIPGVNEAGVSHSQAPINQTQDENRTETLPSPTIFDAGNSYNILEDKIKALQKDLKSAKELNDQLEQEHQESESENLRILGINTRLKNDLAEYDVQLEDLRGERDQLQSTVEQLRACQDDFEQALQRVRDLQQEVEEQQLLIDSKRDCSCQTLPSNRSSLYEEYESLGLAGYQSPVRKNVEDKSNH